MWNFRALIEVQAIQNPPLVQLSDNNLLSKILFLFFVFPGLRSFNNGLAKFQKLDRLNYNKYGSPFENTFFSTNVFVKILYAKHESTIFTRVPWLREVDSLLTFLRH